MSADSFITVGDAPIALVDSGVGGLSVLRTVCKLMPRENFLYVADTARLPYGSRTESDVVSFSCQMINLAVSMGAKLVLVACNTSSVSIPAELYQRFSVPVMNIVASFSDAKKDFDREKRAAVIATELTIASGVYQKIISQFNLDMSVIGVPCPMLVPIIENEVIPLRGVEWVLLQCLAPLLDSDIGTIVYGCSHYAFLDNEIRKVLGKNVNVIDPAEYFARHVAHYVNSGQLERYSATARLVADYCIDASATTTGAGVRCNTDDMRTLFFTTGDPVCFASNVKRLLGFSPRVERVIVGEVA